MTTIERPDWQRAIDPRRTAFFLDVDGTLLGFKPHPEDVVADDALRGVLRRLQVAADGAVALVSGRMIDDLDRIVAPLVLPAAGIHGAEIRFADGRRTAAAGDALAEVRAKVEPYVAREAGLQLEDKGATLAIHFRQVPEREEEVVRFAEAAIGVGDLMVQRGKMVAEVRSASSHKGRAIEALMETSPFAGRIPLFIGDDITDEYGFEAVNAAGGIAIKVGAPGEPSKAAYRLADPEDVNVFLASLCRSDEGIR